MHFTASLCQKTKGTNAQMFLIDVKFELKEANDGGFLVVDFSFNHSRLVAK